MPEANSTEAREGETTVVAEAASQDQAVAVEGAKAEGAAKAAEASSGASIAAGGAEEAGEAEAAVAGFPDNWRQLLAGDDKDALKTLERYTDPKALWAKIVNQEKALRGKQERPAKPGKDATPEQIAAWRKAEGVPETAEGYLAALKLPDGRVLGDDDKPIAESFAAAMHEAGVPQSAFDHALGWYNDFQERQIAEQAEADEAFKAKSRVALREEMGADFRRNVNAVGTLFQDAPEGLIDRILAGRTADGKVIGDDPAVVRWFSSLALEMNPAATLTPQGQESGQSIEGRLAEIKAIMAGPDAQTKYWKDPAIQAEYTRLLETQDKLKARGRAA